MTLSKQEMPSQNNLLMTEPTLHYGIEKSNATICFLKSIILSRGKDG